MSSSLHRASGAAQVHHHCVHSSAHSAVERSVRGRAVADARARSVGSACGGRPHARGGHLSQRGREPHRGDSGGAA